MTAIECFMSMRHYACVNCRTTFKYTELVMIKQEGKFGVRCEKMSFKVSKDGKSLIFPSGNG